MGVAELQWGAGLIAFSPLVLLFLLVVMKRAELVIISVLGCVLLDSTSAWLDPRMFVLKLLCP